MQYEIDSLRKELSESHNMIAKLKEERQKFDNLQADLKQSNQIITEFMEQLSMNQKTAEKSGFKYFI